MCTDFHQSVEGWGNVVVQALNERAVAVMSRMSDKLTGRDFPADLRNGHDSDSINVQVIICPIPSPLTSNTPFALPGVHTP